MMGFLPYVVAVWLFVVGLYGVITSRNYIHLVVCLGVVQSSTYALLLGAGFRTNSVAPVFLDLPVGTPAVDPIVHALMLVDVVVEATVFAVLMALVIKAHGRTGTLDPDELEVMRG
jgi:multicomponent Na+:H+ antiporter subunit C